jgi:hypothetical protein
MKMGEAREKSDISISSFLRVKLFKQKGKDNFTFKSKIQILSSS